MEPPRRKIIAKVEPSIVRSSIPSRSLSRAASPINNQPLPQLDDSSPSHSPAARPKAKITSSATVGSLRTTSKSSGLTVPGKRTPASSAVGRGTRDRPTSMIGTPTRAPFGRPASPAVPPSRRAQSPQPRTGPRLLSPEPPAARGGISAGTRIVRLAKSPSPPLGKNVLSPPASSRRALSPPAPAGRQNMSPTWAPPLTIPRRTTSPTRSSIFSSQRPRSPTHRRVASASASSSVVSGGGDQPSTPPNELAGPRRKLPSSLSAITLTRPPTFSAVPPSPSRPAYPELPSPLLAALDLDIQSQSNDSSPEPADLSAPISAVPQGSPSVQDLNRVTLSAPATPSYAQPKPGRANVNGQSARPRNSSVTIVPGADDIPERPQISAVLGAHNESTPKDSYMGMRIKAKVTATAATNGSSLAKPVAHVRPQQLAAPPRHRSGSISAGSSLSGLATSTLSRTSSVRVTSASRILSPPPDRSIPGLSLLLPDSSVSIPPAMRSPPVSTLSSTSSASQTSTSSRADSSAPATSIDRSRTPIDPGLRSKVTAVASRLSCAGALYPPDEEGADRDDSGIDMFEADDADPEQDQREEARSNRKIADLEISNKSLLAINASLESTKARQAKEIRDLGRKLRESRLVLPPSAYNALERADPLETTFKDEDDEGEDSEDNDVTQIQADETYARVRTLLDQLLTTAKEALEAKLPPPDPTSGIVKKPIRVLDVHEVKRYVNKQVDELTESKATDSVAGDLAESIDDDATSVSMDKVEETGQGGLTTPKHQSTSFGFGIFSNWGQR